MMSEYRSNYLKEMGISEWSLRADPDLAAPTQSSDSTSKSSPQSVIEPCMHWLFYGSTPTGDAELLFQSIVRALGLLPAEWEWRELDNKNPPNSLLPCVAFAFGERAAQSLSNESEPLANLREVVLELADRDIPLVASFDLAHLLAQPKDKALLWQDLLLARSVLQSL
jgi:DNA polymerase